MVAHPKYIDMSVQTDTELIQRIERALAEIRPYLESDGGDISLVDVTPEMVVRVKLHGACQSCSVNQMTLTAGVEQSIKKYAPEVKEVQNIDD
jgi:Fe-S cluster biogenesis protein NfuA